MGLVWLVLPAESNRQIHAGRLKSRHRQFANVDGRYIMAKQGFDFSKVRKSIAKNVHFVVTGELPQEDLLAQAEKALLKLDAKSREKILRKQPEVAMLEMAVETNATTAEMLNENMLAAISGAGWLIDLMGKEVSVEVLAKLRNEDLPKLDADVRRQESRLRTAKIKATAAHNADMLLQAVPSVLTGMLIDKKEEDERLRQIEAMVIAAKGKPNGKGNNGRAKEPTA